MVALLRWLVSRLAVVPWLLKTFGGLAVLVPLALLLKTVGLPIIAILGVLAAPVLLVLFVLGLPIFLVLLVGGGLLAFVFALVSIGLVVLKLLIFVVLPIVLVWKLIRWIFRRGDGGNGTVHDAENGTIRPSEG